MSIKWAENYPIRCIWCDDSRLIEIPAIATFDIKWLRDHVVQVLVCINADLFQNKTKKIADLVCLSMDRERNWWEAIPWTERTKVAITNPGDTCEYGRCGEIANKKN